MPTILIPIFFVLFSSWMLWGWVVGETNNIKWMRVCFAPTFVITAMLISAGAGVIVTRIVLKKELRHNVTELLTAIESRIAAGDTKTVLSEIRATDFTDSPDASDFDLLKHLPEMTENLSGGKQTIAKNKTPNLQ